MEAVFSGIVGAVLAGTVCTLLMGALAARRLKQRYAEGFADGRVAGNEEAGRYRDDKYAKPDDIPAFLQKRRGVA